MSRLEPIAENKPSTDTSSSSRRSALIEQLQQQLDKANRDLVQKNIQLEHQLEIAAQVHESMLPKPVTHPKIDVDIRYLPIEAVGGDYCQVRIPQPDTCYITMCDVTGHGIGAALMATRVSSEVRHFILDMLAPRQIVSELNAFIMNNFADTGLFLSFIAVRIDLSSRTLTYSGSGHPAALLLRGNGEQPVILASQNPLIGVFENCLSDQPEQTVKLEKSDRLLLYTDGLIENAKNPVSSAEIDFLADIAAGAMSVNLFKMADVILEQMTQFHRGPAIDDTTLIVAELK